MTWSTFALLSVVLVASYAIGSIPWAYLIVHWVAHTDITEHGTGNVGAMNVRRTTGSWGWFVVAMLADAAKGILPAVLGKVVIAGSPIDWAMVVRPWGETLASTSTPWVTTPVLWVPMLAVFGAVLGHNYSGWLAIRNKRLSRTGKGLATGAGALFGYDWRYCLIVIVVGLLTIAITRYMMAGQVSAALSLPVGAIVLGSPDWPFAVFMGLLVYAAHHQRFVGLLQGKEPKLYTFDGSGPRG